MNVGELLRERDRLLAIREEAKQAGPKLRQLNQLIALYGDADNVDVSHTSNGKAKEELYCGKANCGAGPFKGVQGLAMHNFRLHGGKYKVAE